MSAFAKIGAGFDVNWTTILVGWNGLGAFSPWPERRDDFPPLLSTDELTAYANECLAVSSDVAEKDLVLKLLWLDLHAEGRQEIRNHLVRLANMCRIDPAFELRKWWLILLEELLDNIPKDALYGLIALTEFWQGFGFPPDSPHEVQGRGNEMAPTEYYRDENLQRLLSRHRAWVQEERSMLEMQKA